ncbi:hypothetical protein GW17_00046612 [Ensete ventricosum]|nr:hypothetical protein GW17_00046612 [Ensete ventricosum]RZS14141.1 hypothetical protein BHM03_00045807 [Ensete ventricosum]
MGNVTSSVAARFAFFPPEPATYEVFRERGGEGRLCLSGLPPANNVEVHLVETKAGNRVVATFWRHPNARFTLLYSHGNAADLGQMFDIFLRLRAHLRVNIMRYIRQHPAPPIPVSSIFPLAEELARLGFAHVHKLVRIVREDVGKLGRGRLGLLGNVTRAPPSRGLSRDPTRRPCWVGAPDVAPPTLKSVP